MRINVKIKKLAHDVSLPKYATSGSAALDLASASMEPIHLRAHARALVPTGIAIAIQDPSAVALICARSGLAAKRGISLANGVGVIDSDYRGEIFVSLINNSDEDFTVEFGDRIAQLMFLPVLAAELIPTDELDPTERGEGGFGSTGV